ncbi:MAG: hypothetical protein KDD66_10780 [Bdellovibrionales bacterium]|nr:hypothetical protein [Bdellovibrionales bacterium]
MTYKSRTTGAVAIAGAVLFLLVYIAVAKLPASADESGQEEFCFNVETDLKKLIVESNAASRLLDSKIEYLSSELSECLGESKVKLGAPIIQRSNCFRTRPDLEELRVQIEALSRQVRELALIKYYHFDDLRRCSRGPIFL